MQNKSKTECLGSVAASQEQWRPVAGYEREYAVHVQGQVWSYVRKKFLKGWVHTDGSTRVIFRDGTKHYVRRLVAEAFLPEFRPGLDVQHINRVKTDSRLVNLRLFKRIKDS